MSGSASVSQFISRILPARISTWLNSASSCSRTGMSVRSYSSVVNWLTTGAIRRVSVPHLLQFRMLYQLGVLHLRRQYARRDVHRLESFVRIAFGPEAVSLKDGARVATHHLPTRQAAIGSKGLLGLKGASMSTDCINAAPAIIAALSVHHLGLATNNCLPLASKWSRICWRSAPLHATPPARIML